MEIERNTALEELNRLLNSDNRLSSPLIKELCVNNKSTTSYSNNPCTPTNEPQGNSSFSI